MIEKNCRLCLKTICENFQIIGEDLKDAISQPLNLNLRVSKETVMCNECANNIQVFFNFKTNLVNVKNKALLFIDFNNDVSMNLGEIEDISNAKSIGQVECCFCAQNAERNSLTSLNESKENMSLMDMLKQHMPELNSNNTEELLICDACIDSLQNLLNFIMNCLDVEQRISRYIEVEGTDGSGHIELRDVQQFTSKLLIKYEIESPNITEIEETCDNSERNYDVKPKTEIDNLASIIKTEFVDIKNEFVEIKSEQDDRDGFSIQEPPGDDSEETRSTEIKEKINKINSATSSEVKKYRCELCMYETKRRSSLISHTLIHKTPSEVTMHRCHVCKFETKHKSSLTVHMVTHRNPSEIIKYRCGMCSYEARFRKHLKRHMWIHGAVPNVAMSKCEICGFETRHKSDLNRHALSHKNPSELPSHKCDLCTYETIHKKNLNRHMLSHKAPSEVTIHRCRTCTFETKDKSSLYRHLLTHRDPSEMVMFRCALCKFETKQKRYLKPHMLTHRKVPEETVFRCELCAYETNRKRNLQNHVVVHKNPS